MSSALSHSPTHHGRDNTRFIQESNLLRLNAIQDDRATMAIGDPANPALAMIGTWATENFQNVNLGLNGHVGNSDGTTGYGIGNNSSNRPGVSSHGQHASIAPGISVPDLKMRDGPRHQPVLNGGLTTRVSQTNKAANSKPRGADLEPMQRWVDENAKEGPWNGVSMQRNKI